MSQTPSARRREGRHAFYPEGDPENNFYRRGKSWGWDMKERDYIDGWNQAKAEHEHAEEQDREDTE